MSSEARPATPEAAEQPALENPSGERARRPSRAVLIEGTVVAAVLLVSGALLGYTGRFWTFFLDDWGIIAYRRSGGVSAFLAPHDGHLQATVIATYRVLFALFGLHSYRPYQAVLIISHLVVVLLAYLYCRSRVGRAMGALVAAPLILVGYAWQVLFWADTLGFVYPMIIFLLVLRSRRWRPWLVSVGLALALASFGLGIAVAVGAAVLAWGCEGQRRTRLTAVAIPLVLYGLWFLFYRPSASTPGSLRAIPGAVPTGDVGTLKLPAIHVGAIVRYLGHSAEAAADGLSATGPTGGWWLLAVVVLLILVSVAIRRSVTVEFVAIAATLIVFWLETALTRSQFVSPTSPDASRYVYPAVVLLVLLTAEAAAGLRLWMAVRLAVLGAVIAIMVSDVDTLRTYEHASRLAFAQETARLKAAQCHPNQPSTNQPDPVHALGLTEGPYLAAVHALGSPEGQTCPRR